MSSMTIQEITVRSQQEWDAWLEEFHSNSNDDDGDENSAKKIKVAKLSLVPFGNAADFLQHVRVTQELEILQGCLEGNVTVLAKALVAQQELRVLKVQATVRPTLHPSSLRILAKAIQKLPELQELNLQIKSVSAGACPLSSPPLSLPLQGFVQMPSLRKLTIADGKYSLQVYQDLLQAVATSKTLKELNFAPVAGYQLSAQDDPLVSMLQQNTSLRKVQVAVHEQSSLAPLAQGIRSNKTIQKLYMTQYSDCHTTKPKEIDIEELKAFDTVLRNNNYSLQKIRALRWELACAPRSSEATRLVEDIEFHLQMNRLGKRRYLTQGCFSNQASPERWLSALANLKNKNNNSGDDDVTAIHFRYLLQNPSFWCPATVV